MNDSSNFHRALREEHPAATPANSYQLFLRDAKGCHIYRDAGVWCIGANPERLETTGVISHIPNADQDEAVVWSARFDRENPVLGPKPYPKGAGGWPVYPR